MDPFCELLLINGFLRFFNDLLGGGSSGILHATRVLYDGDTYVSLPGNVELWDQMVIRAIHCADLYTYTFLDHYYYRHSCKDLVAFNKKPTHWNATLI